MRIVVFSDSHRRVSNVLDIFERHKDNADLFLFLGDGNDDVDTALTMYKSIKIDRVSGNCDFSSPYPSAKVIELAGKRILFTHGHPYYVKHGLSDLQREAVSCKADICLFGHTHNRYIERIDDIQYMNPGTASMGSYGIIDIIDGKINAYCTSV
ncbi:MAG: YfcE family phosphodiesterase [Eubacterium sp.]